MRWCVLLFLLMASGGAWAVEVLLIPENNPKPIYPLALFRAGVTGEVGAEFTVHANGSVDRISFAQSSHPELIEAVRVAIEQWRFKPWAVEGDRPAERRVLAPMVFRLDLDQPIHINQQLKALKCRTLNEYIGNIAEQSWIDTKVFVHTRAYVSNVFHNAQLPDEQRLAMIATLNKRIPSIVKSCRRSPVRTYMSLLPEDIRSLM
ncbi:energy transducer TonB [Pseudomonas fluorescens]|nr:energy transducer TonB [Pseudomonas fluorescens]QTD36176.1 energy transducer TonB [Pseudomonas fluorescens]